MKKNFFVATAALSIAAGWAGAAHAQQQYAEADTDSVIVVTATRTARNVDEVPATISVITDEDIENDLANDIKDLTRFEPGISVRTQPSRFGAALASTGRDGNSGFNIRGLEGNRILFTVDGVRIPDSFSFGPASFGRGDFVDLDLLRSVEILRGPSSALYGSDGIAGAVSFITKDPVDFLQGDENFAGRLRATYASADDSWAESVITAGRAGDWSGLIAYTRRDGHELDNQGDNHALNNTRTAPNPQDAESNAVLARVVYAPSDSQRLRLTYEYGDRDTVTEAYSGRAVPPLTNSSVIDLDGEDSSDSQRVALDYTFSNEGGFIDHGQATLYWQESNARQFSAENRNVSADRTRNTTFDNDVWGGALQFESAFNIGALQQRFVYGFDYSSTHQEGLRNGIVPPVGETFPVRPFPNTDYELAGAFVQDQISLLDGQLTLFPAVRYDYYKLSPDVDALYPIAAPGQSDSHVSPSFGAVAWPTEHFGAFFNYASGFKAPAPSEVNNFFENPLMGYTSLPNPDLKPETSDSVEVGIRMRDVDFAGARLRGSVSVFDAWYDDFISQQPVGVSGGGLTIYQYINLSEVDISGVEGRADLNWANGFGLRFAASWTEGTVRADGDHSPLNSIDPWKAVAGLTYDDPNGRFGGQFIFTYSAGKDVHDVTQDCTDAFGSPTPCFVPDDPITLLDLTAYWNITDAASLRVGLFNLTDESYWWWSDVRGQLASSTVLDAYTQPGRNFSASISYRF